MKKWILLICLGLSYQSLATWDLNDVSFLLPLPKTIDGDQLMRLQTPGNGGNLLDPELILQMPRLTVDFTQAQVIEKFRVLGVRIDPCFPLPTPLACQKQVRLIWQILSPGDNHEVETVDSTLHSFYELSDQQFSALLQDLLNWKEKYKIQTAGKALQVHPDWVAQADQSPSLQEFQKIIAKYVGRPNLIRVTAMLLRGAGDMWVFESFEFRNGNFEMQPIPRLNGQQAQAFINFSLPADHFRGPGINPRPDGADVINVITADSEQIQQGHDDVIRTEFEVIARIENPKSFSPENMDCVSCHVAQSAKYWVLDKKGELNLSSVWSSLEYKNARYNLENKSINAKSTHNLRAFGYFGREATFSQRVINESAEVADLLNQKN